MTFLSAVRRGSYAFGQLDTSVALVATAGDVRSSSGRHRRRAVEWAGPTMTRDAIFACHAILTVEGRRSSSHNCATGVLLAKLGRID